MENNERNDREPTKAEVGLWERILDGMLVDDEDFVSAARAAFQAWCLTVIMQYTDWLCAKVTIKPDRDDIVNANTILHNIAQTDLNGARETIAMWLKSIREDGAEAEQAKTEIAYLEGNDALNAEREKRKALVDAAREVLKFGNEYKSQMYLPEEKRSVVTSCEFREAFDALAALIGKAEGDGK